MINDLQQRNNLFASRCYFVSLFVSSILNKLTPDKFDKLSLELLNVGIDTPQILKGIILLVRDLMNDM